MFNDAIGTCIRIMPHIWYAYIQAGIDSELRPHGTPTWCAQKNKSHVTISEKFKVPRRRSKARQLRRNPRSREYSRPLLKWLAGPVYIAARRAKKKSSRCRQNMQRLERHPSVIGPVLGLPTHRVCLCARKSCDGTAEGMMPHHLGNGTTRIHMRYLCGTR